MSGIRYETQGSIGILVLDRPDKLNAIDVGMLEDMLHVLDEAAADDGIRALVVRGAGRAFSAGYDLAEEQAADADSLRAGLERDFAALMRVFDFPKPIIAAVHGYCLGFALELVSLCDLAIAAEDCRFGAPEVRFGSGAVCMILPWMVGQKHAREILLTGRDAVGADRALEMGLVNRVVPSDSLEDAAIELAMEIARNDALAVRLTKQALNESLEAAGLREALARALEIEIRIEATETPESAEFNRILEEEGPKAALRWRAETMQSGKIGSSRPTS